MDGHRRFTAASRSQAIRERIVGRCDAGSGSYEYSVSSTMGRGLDPENGGTGSGEQIKARKWIPEEDTKLANAAAKLGNEWTKVAELVPGCMSIQCSQRWLHSSDPANGAKHRKWSEAEDFMLVGIYPDDLQHWEHLYHVPKIKVIT